MSFIRSLAISYFLILSVPAIGAQLTVKLVDGGAQNQLNQLAETTAFGDVPIGTSKTKSDYYFFFECSSDSAGNCPGGASVLSVGIVGTSEYVVSSDECTGMVAPDLPPGGRVTCYMAVRFTPLSTGIKRAVLRVNLSFPDLPYIDINLSGNGIDPMNPALPPIDSKISCVVSAHSSINIDTLALQEEIPLIGIPFSLNYSSYRLRPGISANTLAFGLGGWTPSPLHYYDKINHVLYLGNGQIRPLTAIAKGTGFYATDASGSEYYSFDSNGRHLATRDTLTGAIWLRAIR
jgi:hypothetical protein